MEITVLKSCVVCDNLFIPIWSRDLYCSDGCYLKYRREHERERRRIRRLQKVMTKPEPIPSDMRYEIIRDIVYNYRKRTYHVNSYNGNVSGE